MSKLTEDELIDLARQMFNDGTHFSERYSRRAWRSRGWPEIDDKDVYSVLDAYIKFLRLFEKYRGEDEETNSFDVLASLPKTKG